MLFFFFLAETQRSRGDVKFVESFAAKGTAARVGDGQPIFPIDLAFRVITNHSPPPPKRAPYESFAVHRKPIRDTGIRRRLHKYPAVRDCSGLSVTVVGVDAVAKRVREIQ